MQITNINRNIGIFIILQIKKYIINQIIITAIRNLIIFIISLQLQIINHQIKLGLNTHIRANKHQTHADEIICQAIIKRGDKYAL